MVLTPPMGFAQTDGIVLVLAHSHTYQRAECFPYAGFFPSARTWTSGWRLYYKISKLFCVMFWTIFCEAPTILDLMLYCFEVFGAIYLLRTCPWQSYFHHSTFNTWMIWTGCYLQWLKCCEHFKSFESTVYGFVGL